MIELNRQWRVGEEVSLPKVIPYQIVRLVGDAGNIHISERGKYHVFWHRELPDRIVRIHHGGPEGFGSLAEVKRQHERVILGYMGVKIDIPKDLQNEMPEEERKEGLSHIGSDFPTLARELDVLRLPGEQQRIRDWVGVLQEVSQDLPTITNHGKLTTIRERLADLLQSKSLAGATNKYKQLAREVLQKTVDDGDRGELLFAVSKAQMPLLQRAQQTVAITLGTMKRYNDIERLQIEWNSQVEKLPGMAAFLLQTLLDSSLPAEILERRINRLVFDETQSLANQLSKLQGEPYFSKARDFIDRLSPLKELWEARDKQRMFNVLTQEAQELEVWKRRIEEEHKGVGFGRYNLVKA